MFLPHIYPLNSHFLLFHPFLKKKKERMFSILNYMLPDSVQLIITMGQTWLSIPSHAPFP